MRSIIAHWTQIARYVVWLVFLNRIISGSTSRTDLEKEADQTFTDERMSLLDSLGRLVSAAMTFRSVGMFEDEIHLFLGGDGLRYRLTLVLMAND